MSYLLLVFLSLLMFTASAAERWKINYYFDKPDSAFEMRGIQFPSDQRGFVFGVINSTKEREKAVMLITSNGGAKWTEIPLKENPVALSCIDDSQCWLTTEKGIWKTEESGRDWKKLKKQDGLSAIHFSSAKEGYACGYPKAVWKTTDGGLTWVALPAAKALESNPETSSYDVIAQHEKNLIIVGTSRPKRMDGGLFPDWMEPERASRRRQWPSLSLMLDSRNSGESWTASSASLFGRIQAVVLGDKIGVSLLTFEESFEVASEVLQIDYITGKSANIYRDKNRTITSIYMDQKGMSTIGGTETIGSFRANPTPSKVHILRAQLSKNQTAIWEEMPVDYRAVAHRVIVTGSPSGKLWAATDAGMILEWKN